MREEREKIEKMILEFLKQNPHGVTISEMSRQLKINRITLSKYLDVLREKGLIDYRTVGRAKLWFLATDVSILEVMFGEKEILKAMRRDENNFLTIGDIKFIIFPSEFIQDLYLFAAQYNLRILRDLGKKLGSHVVTTYKIYSGVKRPGMSVAQSLIRFLEKIGIGKIQDIIMTDRDIIITFENNIIVEELEHIEIRELKGKNKCIFLEGFIEGLLENLLERPFKVTEIKCKLNGSDVCEFYAEKI